MAEGPLPDHVPYHVPINTNAALALQTLIKPLRPDPQMGRRPIPDTVLLSLKIKVLNSLLELYGENSPLYVQLPVEREEAWIIDDVIDATMGGWARILLLYNALAIWEHEHGVPLKWPPAKDRKKDEVPDSLEEGVKKKSSPSGEKGSEPPLAAV